MLGGLNRAIPSGSAPLIGVLAAIFVCAIAFKVPPSHIEVPDVGAQRGFLLGVSRFSDRFAEQLGRYGYNYIAIDFTKASLDKDAIWRKHLEMVSQRRFPVWGWVEVRSDAGLVHARAVLDNLKLAKLFVYGPDAVAAADELGDPRVIPVVRTKDKRPDDERDYAVVMTPAEFRSDGNNVALPILIADQLDAAGIHAARAAVDGDYLVAGVAILD